MRRTDGDGISADSEETSMAEADLTCLSHQDIETDCGERRYPNQRSDPQVIARRKDQRQQGNHSDQYKERPVAMAEPGKHRLNPLDRAPSEQPLREREQHHKNDDEGKSILVVRADISRTECFEQTEQQSTGDG